MTDTNALAELAVEYWKMLRAFERTIDRLGPEHVAKTAAQLRFSSGRLDSILKRDGLTLVTFDGRPFEPSLPATALNADDFEADENLVVDSTLEPTVLMDMRVLVFGKVILKRFSESTDVSGN